MAQRLLLADDSITIHKVVELILANEGFEIKAVTNGEDALAIIYTFKPDIVLADVEMPRLNGYFLCEKIKQDPSTSDIPVILLAGAFEPFDEELAKRVESDGFVVKPFESQELISKINETLSSAAMREGAINVKEAPAAEGEAAEEDLWSMEEIPETAELEGLPLEEEEEVGKGDIFEAEGEIGVVIEAEPKGTVPPFTRKAVPAEEAAGLEAELPSRDELKEIFEKTLNSKMSSLLSSIDIREIIPSFLVSPLKESIEKILSETMPEVSERMLQGEMKDIFEKTVNTNLSSFLSSIDFKEAVQSSLEPIIKDSVADILSEKITDLTEKLLKDALKDTVESLTKDAEQTIIKSIQELTEITLKDTLSISFDSVVKETIKTVGEILPNLVETTLREELKASLESLKKEIENVIWKTIPDLAEAIILKEIERIRSEF